MIHNNILTSEGSTASQHIFLWAKEAAKIQSWDRYWHLGNITHLHKDKLDFDTKLTEAERNAVIFALPASTMLEDCVGLGYKDVLGVIGNESIVEMLSSFQHIEFFSHKNSYDAFMQKTNIDPSHYKSLHDELHYMFSTIRPEQRSMQSWHDVAATIARISAFSEGVILFSFFAFAANFQRMGMLPGLGQIVNYSMSDENLHMMMMSKLFWEVVKLEEKEIDLIALRKDLLKEGSNIIDVMDLFIDHLFSFGSIRGLQKEELKEYARYRCDLALALNGVDDWMFYGKDSQPPLQWMEEMTSLESDVKQQTRTSTSYVKSTSGNWSDVYNGVFYE